MRRFNLIALLFFLSPFAPSFGSVSSVFYKEINLIGGYASHDQWEAQTSNLKNSVGFEDFRKFSSDRGDFLTTNLQARLAYNEKKSTDDAWAIEIHNAWAETPTRLGKLKVGHFDPAFGLEFDLDTHSTLLQTLAPQHLGFKKDWGIGLKNIFPKGDLDVALQTGSGMALRRTDRSFLSTARWGMASAGGSQGGVSVLYGRVLQSKGMGTIPPADLQSKETIQKKRVALDGQTFWASWSWLGEIMIGEDNQRNVAGALLAAGRPISFLKNSKFDWQIKSWTTDIQESGKDNTELGVSLTHQATSALTLRMGVFADIHKRRQDEQTKAFLQVYYYGL